MTEQRSVQFLQGLLLTAGVAICLRSFLRFPVEAVDWQFMILAAVLVGFSARLTIQVPQVNAHISFSDTLTFLALLLYGGDAAILLAATEALCSSLRFRRQGVSIKTKTILLNTAMMAASMFLTVTVLRLKFYPITTIPSIRHWPTFLLGLSIMALTQYLANSGLVALFTALKKDESFVATWRKHCLWSSITYFTGAAAAGLLVRVVGAINVPTMLVTGVVVAVVYFTYRRYIEDIKQSARQAEQAERERAEQAERHIGELNESIEEQKRISAALKESKERFRHAALHDALTGLPNRTLFAEHLRKAIERTTRDEHYIFAVLFLDFDRFKYVNDSLGHTFGDQLLIEISNRLQDCVRQVDTVARFGGDEFAILLDGINSSTLAIHIAERIQQAMTVPFCIVGHETFLTTSVGIALSTQGYTQPEEVLRDADIAMYRAKDSGKARHEVFDKTMHAQTISRLNLENDLRRALERREFFLVYQPLVQVASGKLYGFEALVRWQHPERGIVPPMEFIPVAEETGLIVPLGHWVLEESCRQVREWQTLFPAFRSLTLSVNLSGKQLNNPKLIQEVKDILFDTGFDPSCLKLEITESVVMENAEASTVLLKQLRTLGLQLSIDDFGTGYSSLSYLHRFPVTTLKIDRSFVSRMGQGDENLEIVRTIVTLAKNLTMDVVAEGIETQEQRAQLHALGCQYGQGYLFSKPLDVAAAVNYIKAESQPTPG
ncbi:MAG TPA: EAL domain-containing protein, partial [Blastocatellia bacterium]|nr:EAL domain-containing protein [Blastocatellia bacterium]